MSSNLDSVNPDPLSQTGMSLEKLQQAAKKKQDDEIDFLEQRRGKIVSHTGGWFPGKGVFTHGYSLLDELVGEKTYMQLLVLQATGRLVDAPLGAWIEAIYGCLSWPDPRIWCNQIGALAGTSRCSVVAATALGALAADSRTYGALPIVEGVAFIQTALAQHEGGMTPEEIVLASIPKRNAKPVIVGYKRPIAKGDERIAAMERVGHKLGFVEGPHLALAYKIEQVLRRDYDEGMNINGYGSAFMADQGFEGQELYQMFALLVASGVTACYRDAYNQPAGAFLPLRCTDIDYLGPPARALPLKN